MELLITGLLLLATLAYAAYTYFMSKGLLKAAPAPVNNTLPDVAVVIAARDEELNLPDLLADLAAQDYDGKLDIYIADDRSTDNTWPILNSFSQKHAHFHPFRIVTTSTTMTPKKNALTQCLKQTTAEIILSTDADCRVGPRWVQSAVRAMGEDVGILVGYSEVEAHSVFEKYQALDFIGVMVSNAGAMVRGYAWSGSGQNLAYKRSAFTEIGGFNPVAHKLSGDDFYLVQSIPSKTGLKAKFNFDSGHFVKTKPAPTIGAFIRQRIRWSSNSRGLEKSDPLFFFFLLSAYLSNLTLLLSLLLGWLNPVFWFCLSLKLLAEGVVMLTGSKLFGYGPVMWVFPLWFLLQPIYITYVGLMGLRGKFTWKP